MKFRGLLLTLVVAFLTSTPFQIISASQKNDIEAEVHRLALALFYGPESEKAAAHENLCRIAERDLSGLEALINEMNKPEYLSDEKDLEKLGDSKWKNRIWLASIIEFVTKEDFKTNTSAHGWDPDISFRLINKWWAEHEKNEG